MELPVLLPDQFLHLEEVLDEGDLLKKLQKTPQNLVVFIEAACSDETWALNHPGFIKKAFGWWTHHFYLGSLDIDIARSVQKSVLEHYDAIATYIPKDIIVDVVDRSMPVNCLLLGMSSPYLLNLFRQECTEKEKKNLRLALKSKESLEPIIEYIHSGQVKDIWKKDRENLLKLLRDASILEMDGLVHLCAATLKKYLHPGNVIPFLIMSHKNSWEDLRKSCIDFLNGLNLGIKFLHTHGDVLSLEFSFFSEAGMNVFHAVKNYITHLAFHGVITIESAVADVLKDTPHLKGLDISQTKHYSQFVMEAPSSVGELDLSMCSWLDNAYLEQFIDKFPHLKSLKISSNVQFNYDSWALLGRLKGLQSLSIARSQQLTDEDFILIARGCPTLHELDVEDCPKLSDVSVTEIARIMPSLIQVNLSRTAITDTAVINVCYYCKQLQVLNLTRCSNITDYGVFEALKANKTLKIIVLSSCN